MKNISGVLKGINDKKNSKKDERYYLTSGFLRTVYNTEEDFAKTAGLFKVAQKNLAKANFNYKIFTSKLLMVTAMALKNSGTNFEEVTERMKQVAAETELRGCGKNFFENFGM